MCDMAGILKLKVHDSVVLLQPLPPENPPLPNAKAALLPTMLVDIKVRWRGGGGAGRTHVGRGGTSDVRSPGGEEASAPVSGGGTVWAVH